MQSFRGLVRVCLAFVMLGLAGCGRVEVQVTAFLSRENPIPAPTPENAIAVVPRAEPPNALFEREVAIKIEHLLHRRGYATAPREEARYVLFCIFGIDAGRRVVDARPVYHPGGVTAIHTYGSQGAYATTIHGPGRVEYVPYEYTLFARQLALELTDQDMLPVLERDELHQAVIWRCDALSVGESPDMRWYVNHLLLAAFEYFGEDTGKQKREKIGRNDKHVKRLARVAMPDEADEDERRHKDEDEGADRGRGRMGEHGSRERDAPDDDGRRDETDAEPGRTTEEPKGGDPGFDALP